MIRLSSPVVVLDLDDTLYLERDFARSGFAAAGLHLGSRCDADAFARRCFDLLESGRRGDIFNCVLEEFGIAAQPDDIAELVRVYRDHSPDIGLCDDADQFLDRFSDRYLAIISDGPASMQRSKVDALGLPARVNRIVLTGEWEDGFGKPHPRAFDEVEQACGFGGSECVYIADNVGKDFFAPNALGWITIQIVRAGRIHVGDPPTPAHVADHQVESLNKVVPA